MIKHPNGYAYGTLRRAPRGFAHAILLDQGGADLTWEIIDLYGAMEVVTDEYVKDWPVVYEPVDDEEWVEP